MMSRFLISLHLNYILKVKKCITITFQLTKYLYRIVQRRFLQKNAYISTKMCRGNFYRDVFMSMGARRGDFYKNVYISTKICRGNFCIDLFIFIGTCRGNLYRDVACRGSLYKNVQIKSPKVFLSRVCSQQGLARLMQSILVEEVSTEAFNQQSTLAEYAVSMDFQD